MLDSGWHSSVMRAILAFHESKLAQVSHITNMLACNIVSSSLCILMCSTEWFS